MLRNLLEGAKTISELLLALGRLLLIIGIIAGIIFLMIHFGFI